MQTLGELLEAAWGLRKARPPVLTRESVGYRVAAGVHACVVEADGTLTHSKEAGFAAALARAVAANVEGGPWHKLEG